jgi:hypothetical protein
VAKRPRSTGRRRHPGRHRASARSAPSATHWNRARVHSSAEKHGPAPLRRLLRLGGDAPHAVQRGDRMAGPAGDPRRDPADGPGARPGQATLDVTRRAHFHQNACIC